VLSLKIPPPIVGLATATLMWSCLYAVPEWTVSNATFKYAAIVLVIVGLLIELLSVFRFFRAKTTINPLKPDRSKKLVTTGLYRYSRNPMYVGMLAMLFGFGLWLGHPLALLMLIFFVWYITTFQIKPEEHILLEKFGKDYQAYQLRVRRWI